MKTAEEILKKHFLANHDSKPEHRLPLRDVEVGAMHEYANQVAEQALKDASQRTTNFNNFVSVEMILSTPITTP